MRRKITLLAFFMVLAAPVSAEEPRPLAQGEILRGIFVQERVLQGFDAPLRSKGTFVLASGEGLIWHVEKPFASTTLMTGKGLIQQSNDVTTLNIPTSRAPIMTEFYNMLAGALAGNWSSLDKDFAIERSEAAGKWHLRLKARPTIQSNSMPITEIRVSGGAFVDEVEIEKEGGDLDRLYFSEQKRDANVLTEDEKTLFESVGRQ